MHMCNAHRRCVYTACSPENNPTEMLFVFLTILAVLTIIKHRYYTIPRCTIHDV